MEVACNSGSSMSNNTNSSTSSLADLLNQELRRVQISRLTKLSTILDETNSWKKLLEELSKPNIINSYDNSYLNLSLNTINLIEQQPQSGKSPTLALLNYWSITGRRRPTVHTLLVYLNRCNLRRAEHYVCQSILGINSIQDLFAKTSQSTNQDKQVGNYLDAPTERLQITSASDDYLIDNQYRFANMQDLVNGFANIKCDKYSFEEIYKTTNRFCHKPYDAINKQGTKIGEGRFSSVYRAQSFLLKRVDKERVVVVAAKLLKSDCDKKYLINEIKLVEKIYHENILELLGIACAGSNPEDDLSIQYICLLYPFMQNGSLLDCISKGLPTRNYEFISHPDRFNILYKVAQGIAYLHSIPDGAIIHRDIKTANILIDENIQPKIGDFTLVRQLDECHTTETQFSQNVIGTSVYMPPEAFRGDISIKFDTFSYGIVMLEVLTGMRPFNEDEDEDLFTHINDKLSDLEDQFTGSSHEEAKDRFFLSILDPKAGEWDFNKCKALFNISLKATESRKKNRPEMTTLVSLIENALHDHLINWTSDLY